MASTSGRDSARADPLWGIGDTLYSVIGATESDVVEVARRHVGAYELLERIGAGGMGVVYRARDLQRNRDVAVKMVPPDLVGNETARARMLREARVHATLDHPNIGTLFESGDDNGQIWIAMELLPGPTLAARMLDAEPAEIRRWGSQIASALAYAHAAGVVHRDLKPSNVILTKAGDVKLVDFGLAKVVAPSDPEVSTSFETRDGTRLGTPRYMSPEQMRGAAVGPASDIFSFGLLLYELLARTSAFAGETGPDRIAALLRDDPRPLPPGKPPDLSTCIAECLQRDPAKRPAARELANRIAAVDRKRKKSRPRRQELGAAMLGIVLARPATSPVHEASPSEEILIVPGGSVFVRGAAFDDSGDLYYVVGAPGQLWHTGDGGQIVPNLGSVSNVKCCIDHQLVIESDGSPLRLFDPRTRVVSAAPPDLARTVDVSPDGTWIAERNPACGNTFGSGVLVRRRWQTTPTLALCAELVFSFRWSPDGTRLAYFSGPTIINDVIVVDLTTPRPEPRQIATVANGRFGRISRGLHWASNDQLVVFDPGNTPSLRELVLDETGRVARETVRPLERLAEPVAWFGERAAFIEHHTRSDMVVGMLADFPVSVIPLSPSSGLIAAGWTSDGRVVGALRESDNRYSLAIVPPGGTPSFILHADPNIYFYPLAIVHDQILFNRVEVDPTTSRGRKWALWIVDSNGWNARELQARSRVEEVRCASDRCVSVSNVGVAHVVRELDAKTGKTSDLFAFGPAEGGGMVLGLSSDGRRATVLDRDNGLLTFDLETKRMSRRTIAGAHGIQSLAYEDETTLLLTENVFQGGRGLIRVYDDDRVDALSVDGSWVSNPVVDPTRRRVVLNRMEFVSSLFVSTPP